MAQLPTTSHASIAAHIAGLISSGMDEKAARSQAYRAATHEALDFQDVEGTSSREENHLGYILIRDNPIMRAGVFQYPGRVLPGADPQQVYNVYRPIEELTTPETLASFVGLPIVDEHEMLGGKYPRGAEERGVHGAILENIIAVGNDILAPIRIFSRSLKRLLDAGKRGLSMGYNCRYEKSSGEFGGIAYNYIQRDIRGNHLALVTQGRNATAVLDEHDVLDHFDLALDTGELTMADETKGDEKKTDAAAELTMAEVVKFLKAHAPMWKEVQSLMAAETTDDDTALDGDTKEEPGDTKKDKAEDEDKKDDDKEDKKEAMDTNDVNKLLDARLGAERKVLAKTLRSDFAAASALAKELETHIGTFAFDTMDVNEVAAYGAEKLSIPVVKGQEVTAVHAFLAGMKKGAGSQVTYAMDSAATPKPKAGGLLSKRVAAA